MPLFSKVSLSRLVEKLDTCTHSCASVRQVLTLALTVLSPELDPLTCERPG